MPFFRRLFTFQIKRHTSHISLLRNKRNNILPFVCQCVIMHHTPMTTHLSSTQVVKSHQTLGEGEREREGMGGCRVKGWNKRPQPRESGIRPVQASEGFKSWHLQELLQTDRQYSSESKLFLFPPQPPNRKGAQVPFSGTKYQRSSMA